MGFNENLLFLVLLFKLSKVPRARSENKTTHLSRNDLPEISFLQVIEEFTRIKRWGNLLFPERLKIKQKMASAY